MKIVFMGTPDFAVPCLQSLIDSEHEVAGVFCQPDKKTGRKQVLTPPPVKTLALKYDIPVYQPVSLKNEAAFDIIKEIKPDLIAVVAYGKILPKDFINFPEYGCMNVHASLLPKYRGAAPIQWAILNGEKETGITVMQMDEGLDTGDMLYVEKTEILFNETSAELFDRLSVIGAGALIKTIKALENGEIVPVPQPEGDFGYASMIDKSMSPIDWKKSAFEIHNQIRGLQTWPAAATVISGRKVKIHKSSLSKYSGNAAGEVVNNKNVLSVCCGDGKCIDILEIQAEGKKRMDIKSFLSGNKLEIGTVFGK